MLMLISIFNILQALLAFGTYRREKLYPSSTPCHHYVNMMHGSSHISFWQSTGHVIPCISITWSMMEPLLVKQTEEKLPKACMYS